MSYKPKFFLPDEDFYNTHITFTSSPQIKEMLVYLKCVDITYFSFDRSYKDGSHIRLTSSREWAEDYYRHKLYEVAIFEKDPSMFSNGVLFWSWLNPEPVYTRAALHDIAHGMTIIQKHKLYCDFFHFGTTQDNYIPEAVFLSRINVLYRFIAIFKQKAHSLIKKAESERFILPNKIEVVGTSETVIAANNLEILKYAEIKRFYLGDEFENNYLTGKEMQILLHLHNGKRLVDTAKLLYISDKTVATHIDNIKNKLRCKTMFELGALSQKLGLQNITFKRV